MKKLTKTLFAIANICCGIFLLYDGWPRSGVFFFTVLFSGLVLFFLGLTILFSPNHNKNKLEYRNLFIERRW